MVGSSGVAGGAEGGVAGGAEGTVGDGAGSPPDSPSTGLAGAGWPGSDASLDDESGAEGTVCGASLQDASKKVRSAASSAADAVPE